MSFWCQSCGEQHPQPHVTSANIATCAKCGGSHFATWKPVLQSLSQEAVRDEALREAVKRYLKEQGDESWWTASERRLAIALKREPNAAAAEGPAHGLPCWPVDRPAPAVVELIAQLHDMAFALEKQGSEHWAMNCGYAAALLAKLGRGWALDPRELKLLIDYHDAKGCEAEAMGVNGSVRYHDKRRAHYEALLPPGASDD